MDDATKEAVRAFFEIVDSLQNLHESLECLDRDLQESKADNERVKTFLSDVDVQRNNLLSVEERVKRLKDDFSKHELDTLKEMITDLKEEEASLKQKVRRLDIKFGKSAVEFEDGIGLTHEQIIGECKEAEDDSADDEDPLEVLRLNYRIKKAIRELFEIEDGLQDLHRSLEFLDRDLSLSQANNERVEAIMSFLDVQRNNLHNVEKKRVRLKEDFCKHESEILRLQITDLKEDAASIKHKVRRLNIRCGKSSVELEDGIDGKCKGAADDSVDRVGKKPYDYKFDYVIFWADSMARYLITSFRGRADEIDGVANQRMMMMMLIRICFLLIKSGILNYPPPMVRERWSVYVKNWSRRRKWKAIKDLHDQVQNLANEISKLLIDLMDKVSENRQTWERFLALDRVINMIDEFMGIGKDGIFKAVRRILEETRDRWENGREGVDERSTPAAKTFAVFLMTFVEVVARLEILLNIREPFFYSVRNADLRGHFRELKSIEEQVKKQLKKMYFQIMDMGV